MPFTKSSTSSLNRVAFMFLVSAVAAMGSASADERGVPSVISTRNASGVLRTFAPTGIDTDNPFFKSLGTTGTTCEHCHFASDAWGLSAAHARALFEDTDGTHPLFSPHAANDPKQAALLTPDSPIEDRNRLYGLLLDKGDVLVRLALRLPSDPEAPAEFTLVGADDPSLPDHGKVEVPGVGLVGDPAAYLAYTGGQLWLHRRPLPTTNFGFLTAVLWDGRNTPNPSPIVAPVRAGVVKVARDTIVSREAPVPGQYTDAELDELAAAMAAFQFSLFTAQAIDRRAGPLDAQGATGGPQNLSREYFFFGINDVLGDNPSHQSFSPLIFDLYDGWAHTPGKAFREARAAVVRGQQLFNSKPLHISGVGGLNGATITLSDGVTQIAGPGPFTGTCGSCHDAPNVGNHSTRLPINIGVSDEAPVAAGRAAVEDLPLFTLRNNSTGEIIRTTDPGRATRTGKWAHVGEFKGPILHGLAARAPYFHNGMAATLGDVVNFYDVRFGAEFTEQEKADLVAFLKTL